MRLNSVYARVTTKVYLLHYLHFCNQVFFFNLTNEEDLLEGRDGPRVEKIGPYTYTQKIHRVSCSLGSKNQHQKTYFFQVDPVFSSSGEWVTFSDSKTYFFSPELSEGTEEDVIVMPNIPLFGAFRKLGGSGIIQYTQREVFKSMLSGKQGMDKTPFLTLSVREFLWGYPSIIMTMDEDWGGGGSSDEKEKEERKRRGEESESEDVVEFESNEVDRETKRLEKEQHWADFDLSFGNDFGDDWNDGWGDEDEDGDIFSRRRRRKRDAAFKELNPKQFGFFHGRNVTSQGLRTVHTGMGNITRKGDVSSVGNEEGSRGNWAESRCNRMEGKDPGTLSIGMTKADDLLLYFPNLCRCE